MNKIIDLKEITDDQLDRILVTLAKEKTPSQELINILLKEKGLRIEDNNRKQLF